ncbi:unnamed protein product [marine sediment metagenome]|uniref:Uncharacterized protein n=1 Tax=marine sediment metagenome TaxID=412755 RepID=X0S400_9ZZZZ
MKIILILIALMSINLAGCLHHKSRRKPIISKEQPIIQPKIEDNKTNETNQILDSMVQEQEKAPKEVDYDPEQSSTWWWKS